MTPRSRRPPLAAASQKFDNLPLGAYIVTETVTPAGYIGSKPFIITVPMTHPTEKNEWNYNLHVYPQELQGWR